MIVLQIIASLSLIITCDTCSCNSIDLYLDGIQTNETFENSSIRWTEYFQTIILQSDHSSLYFQISLFSFYNTFFTMHEYEKVKTFMCGIGVSGR